MSNPVSVMRMRGMIFLIRDPRDTSGWHFSYGGWHWWCRRCHASGWGADQSDAIDKGRDHCRAEGAP